MDDVEENTRYPEKAHSNSPDQLKVTLQNSVDFTRNDSNSDDDEVDDVEISDEDDDDDDDDEQKGVQRIGNNELEDDEDDYGNIKKHPKKRKLKSLLSSYELAPRLPLEASSSSRMIGGRNSTDDWSEHETLILLGAWGDKYLENGRKSLRSDEWQEVADKVFQGSQIDRTDSQCRNRVDTLKKKYKTEKAKTTVSGSCFTSKWIYFNKMDSLIDNRVNGPDEERDNSPGNLNSVGDSEGPSRNKTKNRKSSSCSLFVNCVEKFSKIYEKTENNKRQQIQEMEKIRMDFLIDLESQKEQIFQKGYAEIARIHRGDDDEQENGASPILD